MSSNRPVAAKPSKVIFDPFNSSATGHQRAENRLGGSTSWRDSRNSKLNQQYISGRGGGKRQSDTVGAGSEDFGKDGRLENGGWEKGAKGLRTGGQQSIWESMKVQKSSEPPTKRIKLDSQPDVKPTSVVNPFTPFRKEDGSIRETSWTSHEERQDFVVEPVLCHKDVPQEEDDAIPITDEVDEARANKPQIFAGLTIYINGSTAPLISDHKLKFLLSTHGAHTSVALGRRTVTHVIVSKPNSSGGIGGGLASSKLHKEITRHGGKNIRYVTADWIVESVKAGKRLAETRFSPLSLAASGTGNMTKIFGAKNTSARG